MLLKRVFQIKKSLLSNILLKNYSIETIGEGFSKRIFLQNDKKQRISFWNDLSLKTSKNPSIFQCVIEIPFDNLAKMELCKNEPHHPLWQDVRKSKYNQGEQELRYYALFPLFNYGFFPQTWENSLVKHSASGLFVKKIIFFFLRVLFYRGMMTHWIWLN